MRWADETDVVLVNVPCELVTLWYCIVGELAVLANPPRLRFIGDLYKGDVRVCMPENKGARDGGGGTQTTGRAWMFASLTSSTPRLFVLTCV